jgi:magnesium-transporting ATPase (P-type)
VKGTKAVWITVGIITAAQFAITYIPLLQGIFGTEAIALKDGLLIIGVGVLLFFSIEVEKQIRLRLRLI